jgi:serine/threonine protein kinase/Flp pilus assembly protein TadD
MMPAPRSRVLEIVAAARGRPETQREAFLFAACDGDQDLRAEVEEVLAQGDDKSAAPAAAGLFDKTAYPPQNSSGLVTGQSNSAGNFGGNPQGNAGGNPGANFGAGATPLAAGARIGPYQLESQIGSGGMGVVYKARDTRLERNVAIKVIQAKSASTVLEAALLREARLTSSLNHPGIVTIYDILVHGGTTCIVMEFVPGRPLQQLIPDGGLAVERALSIAVAVGDAVAAAHAAGIVHRDLKPGNILMREDGQIKVLDFGLAKIAQNYGPDAETQPLSIFGGSAVGTISYMAPEQARGEEVDERADIFSFGVIFYQLLAGKMPFHAANAVALLHAIQALDPAPLRKVKPEIPAALEGVVRRALAKNPAERYQTIREMLADLIAAPGKAAAAPVPAERADLRSIAVLPLINISPDSENEYICDGLAEELINGLTQIPGLRVVSRSSSFQCKGTTPDVREIGLRLGASLLVHGSLRRSGDNLRLTVQLSQTSEGYQIWSQRFDAQMRDLFALQDELTAAVLEKLREQLGARFPGLDAGRQTPSSEAYDLYLQARFAFNRETPAEFRRALVLFERSAAADPGFAPALLGIAETHMRMDWYGLEPASEAVPLVKSALAAALALQPDSVSSLCNLAITQAGWDWDWIAAGKTFDLALAAGGGLAAVHFHYGLDYLTPLGRLEEALRELRHALQLDPLSPIANTAVGGCLYRMRRWDESAEALRRTLDLNPGFGHAHWSLGRVLLEQGQPDEALQRFEDAAKIMGPIPAALSELGYCHARMGRRDLAHTTIQELQRLAEREWVSPVSAALVYAGLGEYDEAMRCLEEALRKRIRQLVWVNVDPRYDAMRNNPKFEQLIASLGLSPVQA